MSEILSTIYNSVSSIDLGCFIPYYMRSNTIHDAAAIGNIRDLKKYIDAGVDVNQTDLCGQTALYIAAFNDQRTALNLLIKAGADINKAEIEGITPLMIAIGNNHLEVVSFLLAQPAIAVEAVTSNGETALCFAAMGGHFAIANMLIKAGADINKANKDGWTPLMLALGYNSVAIVNLLLSQPGIKIDAVKSGGATALYIAAEKGHVDVAEVLIKAGADVNKARKDGVTPLISAAYNNHLAMVNFLLSKSGIEIDAVLPDGATALYIAAEKGHVDVAEVLINAGSDINKARNDGWTPLMTAASNNRLAIVNFLFSKSGIKIDAVDRNGATALYIAAQKGHVDVASALINAGADINKENKDGATPLMAAACNNRLAMVNFLLSKSGIKIDAVDRNGETALFFVAQEGHVDVAEVLIKAGDDVNKARKDGATPLMAAAYNNRLAMVNFLLSKSGIKIDAVCIDGETALFFAVREGHVDVAEVLIKAGADINKARNNGRTPLIIASYNNRLEMVNFLLSKSGIKIDAVDIYCETAFYSAAWEGHVDVADALIKAGADINKTRNGGATPLMAAAYNNRLAMVKFLLSQPGIKIDAVDIDGGTAFYSAAWEGHVDVANALINAGADINKANNNGWTPLIAAAYNNRLAMVNCLLSKSGIKLAIVNFLLSKSGIKIDAVDRNGGTALFFAAQQGHVDVANALIKAEADINKANNDGWTPLISAAYNNRLAMVNFLLSKSGIKIDAVERNGATALYIAGQEGHVNVANALIKAGADINKARNNGQARNSGQTPLIIASYKNRLAMVNFLLSQPGIEIDAVEPDGTTAFYSAAWEGHVDVANALINAGADINKARRNGVTPLMQAVLSNKLAMVNFLLSKSGIKIDAVDIDGETALFFAVQKGHVDVANALIKAGADINKARNNGRTPLMQAVLSNKLAMVNSLLSQPGTKIDAVDRDGETALFFAAKEGYVDVAEVLIKAGADINKARNNGRTPLIIASYNNRLAMVNFLLSKSGIKIDAVDIYCETAFYSAAWEGHVDVANALINAGADINKTRNGGATPLMAAACNNHLAMVKFLLSQPGIKIDAVQPNGVTALYYALYSGHVDVASALIKAGADINKICATKQKELLQEVLKKADVDVLSLLLQVKPYILQYIADAITEFGIKANDDKKTSTKILLVTYALEQGNIEVLKVILEKLGPDIISEEYVGNLAAQKQFVKIRSLYDNARDVMESYGDNLQKIIGAAGVVEITKIRDICAKTLQPDSHRQFFEHIKSESSLISSITIDVLNHAILAYNDGKITLTDQQINDIEEFREKYDDNPTEVKNLDYKTKQNLANFQKEFVGIAIGDAKESFSKNQQILKLKADCVDMDARYLVLEEIKQRSNSRCILL